MYKWRCKYHGIVELVDLDGGEFICERCYLESPLSKIVVIDGDKYKIVSILREGNYTYVPATEEEKEWLVKVEDEEDIF